MALIFAVLRDMVFRIAARAFAADRSTTAPIAALLHFTRSDMETRKWDFNPAVDLVGKEP